ncbi:MAG: hypothetical protein ACP5H0_04365 [Caldisericum sp.]|uniref:hypothetical protein n=1 Tax=unclassified Caldisericum TaxID=2641600 RepID=UPI0039FDCD0F
MGLTEVGIREESAVSIKNTRILSITFPNIFDVADKRNFIKASCLVSHGLNLLKKTGIMFFSFQHQYIQTSPSQFLASYTSSPFSSFRRVRHLPLHFYHHSLVSKKRFTSKDTPNLVNSISGRRQDKHSYLRDKENLFQGGNNFLLPSLREQHINAFNKANRKIDFRPIYSIV